MSRRSSLHLPHVLVISQSGGVNDIQSILRKTGRYYCELMRQSEMSASEATQDVDIIILDLHEISTAEIDLINAIHKDFMKVPVIAITDSLDENQFKRLLQLDVQDWLRHPVDRDELLSTMETWINVNRSSNTTVNGILGVAGGVGATTVAIALAEAIAKERAHSRKTVSLVDLDFCLADCGSFLNLRSQLNLSGFIEDPGRIDSEFIDLIKMRHDNGMYVYSYQDRELVSDPHVTDFTLRILDLISTSHDISFLDIPYYFQPWHEHVLAAVDTVSIVTTNTIPNIKHALDAYTRLMAMHDDRKNIRIIVNKFDRPWFGGKFQQERLHDIFGDAEIIYLPRDDETMKDSLDQAIPPSEVSGSSSFVKAIGDIKSKFRNKRSASS